MICIILSVLCEKAMISYNMLSILPYDCFPPVPISSLPRHRRGRKCWSCSGSQSLPLGAGDLSSAATNRPANANEGSCLKTGLHNYKENEMNSTRMLDTLFSDDFI